MTAPATLAPSPNVSSRRLRSAVLWRFLLLTWWLLLVNATGYLAQVQVLSPWTVTYVGAMFLTYPAMYLLPVAIVLVVANRVLSWGPGGRPGSAASRRATALLSVLAVLLTASVQLFVFADGQIVRLYGYHVNGFVWNLIITPGGIESLGAGTSTHVAFALLAVGAVVAEALLLLLVLRSARVTAALGRLFPRGVRIAFVVALVLLSAFERVSYGIADAANFKQVVTAAGTFPFYQPMRMHKIAKALGFAAERDDSVKMKVTNVNLRYPLAPLQRAPGSRDWNIVWLVSESLRADMLDPEIMPETSAFAARALDFRDHYSGGNGTRMGMFAMFYGLYGSYWFPFLNETRGPAFFDVLLDAGYDCQAFTSAKFTFPEFNETIFSRFPPERLHEGDDALLGWQNDRANVAALLDSVDARPAGKPFFRFLFFESPHARYYFPPESVIRTPYLEELNYATMDLARDIGLIKNRYVNACHHLDSQLQRVIEGLEQRGLLDSTLVVITGDHGEEFMEKGRWGHHSTFSEEQTRTPLVVWIPGQAPQRRTSLSSHLDIVPTLLARLGVTNPPSDYSLGHDLLGAEQRTDTVIADWDNLACVDAHGKGVFPVNHGGFAGFQVTTADDAPVADPDAWVAANRDRLQRVMKDLSRFSK